MMTVHNYRYSRMDDGWIHECICTLVGKVGRYGTCIERLRGFTLCVACNVSMYLVVA